MENMHEILKETVSRRLAAAPDSVAKTELIDELTANLYSRYCDLTAAGTAEEEARDRAVDALGDTDELVEYLKSLEPHQSLPELVLDPEKPDGGQLEEVLHNVEDILRGVFHKAKSAFGDARSAVKEGLRREHAGAEAEAELEEKRARIEAAQETLEQLENARDALEEVADRSMVEGALADLEVKIGAKQAEIDALEAEADALEDAAAEAEAEAEEAEYEIEGDDEQGWKVTYRDKKGHSVEFGSEELKDSLKDVMKDIEQVLREATGVARDACHTAKEAVSSVCEDAVKACTPDTPVEVDRPIDSALLKAIDVQTYGGDITVRMTQAPEGDVLVGGDIEELEIFRSESGVLTIRPVRTETSSFFFGRGIFNHNSSAEVILDLPCRDWESIRISTFNGDVELSGDHAVEQVSLSSVSGDLAVTIPSCAKAHCKTTNGDVRWSGDVTDFRMESVSGDVQFRGSADSVTAKTTSGDLTLEGAARAVSVRSISGDLCLRSAVLPDRIDVGTTSGDMWADIPDEGPFTTRFRSTSGDFTSDFFVGRMGGRSCTFDYQGGGERQYSFTSVSGDLELRKYR